MIVKLIMTFILISTVYSITVRGAVIYYEGLVYKRLDAYMSVLIGVGGDPTLGQL